MDFSHHDAAAGSFQGWAVAGSSLQGPQAAAGSSLPGPQAVAGSSLQGPQAAAGSSLQGPQAVAGSSLQGPQLVAGSSLQGPQAVAGSYSLPQAVAPVLRGLESPPALRGHDLWGWLSPVPGAWDSDEAAMIGLRHQVRAHLLSQQFVGGWSQWSLQYSPQQSHHLDGINNKTLSYGQVETRGGTWAGIEWGLIRESIDL